MLSISNFSLAEINVYAFDRPQDELRFLQLITELRCPKCQNQNIADSNAPLSKDLKDRVYKMIQEGRADNEIMNFMVERYGDFVLYRPPMKPLTYILWFGPFFIGFFIIVVLIIRRRQSNRLRQNDASSNPLTINEVASLNALFSPHHMPHTSDMHHDVNDQEKKD